MKYIRKGVIFFLTPKFFRFFVSGFLAFLVDTIILNILKIYIFTSRDEELILGIVSTPKFIAACVAIIVSFTLNKYWAFKEKEGNMFSQASKFIVVFLFNVVLASIVFGLYEHFLFELNLDSGLDKAIPTIANIITTGTIMFISFFFYSKFIFNGKSNTDPE